jgi:hypothetical protein
VTADPAGRTWPAEVASRCWRRPRRLPPGAASSLQHAQGDAGTQQRLGWRDQPGDPEEGGGEVGVVGGGGVEAGQVGADQPDLEGSASLDAGEDQVAAGRHVPRHIHHAGEVAEPAAGLRLDAPR